MKEKYLINAKGFHLGSGNMKDLEEIGLVEFDNEECMNDPDGDPYYKNKFKMFRASTEKRFIKLQNKIRILEELTGFNTDDYEWKTTSKTKLVKKTKQCVTVKL